MLVTHGLHAKAAAEFVGTAGFCLIGVSAAMAGDAAGLTGIALAHGFAIAAMVTAVGHISGGHLNPAITLGMVATRRTTPLTGLVYVLMQVLGALAGCGLARVAIPEDRWRAATAGGVPQLAPDASALNGLMMEAALTFFLAWVVMSVAIDRDGSWFRLGALPIGVLVTGGVLAGGTVSGGSMNPIRAFGPAVFEGAWADQWIYWIGPCVGSVLACVVYVYVVQPRYHPNPD